MLIQAKNKNEKKMNIYIYITKKNMCSKKNTVAASRSPSGRRAVRRSVGLSSPYAVAPSSCWMLRSSGRRAVQLAARQYVGPWSGRALRPSGCQVVGPLGNRTVGPSIREAVVLLDRCVVETSGLDRRKRYISRRRTIAPWIRLVAGSPDS